jgi:hypothetical protein
MHRKKQKSILYLKHTLNTSHDKATYSFARGCRFSIVER